jgi:cytochrome P450
MSHTVTEPSGRSCPHLESYDPARDAEIVYPFATWAAARQETPVFFSPVLNSYVVTRYEDINRVLVDPETFSSGVMLKPYRERPREVEEILATGFDPAKLGAMVMLDAPLHTKIRRATISAFSPRRVAALEGEVRSTADELIDAMIAAGPGVDFVDTFAYPLPLRIITRILGVPLEDGVQLHEWATAKMALQFGDLPLAEHIEVARKFVAFQQYVSERIEERRSAPQEDFISTLITFDYEGEPLEDVVLVGQVMGLVNAGHETITTMLTLGLYHLLQDRSHWAALCANPALAAAVVEEVLRFDGPLKMVSRRATRDTEIGGVAIPADSRVGLVVGSANRDETVFQDPDRFDIQAAQKGPQKDPEMSDEKRRPHLAFGRGAHLCAGAPLARMEGRIAFERLATRLPSLRLANETEPEFARNTAVRLPLALHVGWDQ